MLDAVGAGQEAHHLHRFKAGGPRIDRIGADVADNVGAEREYPAVRVERQVRRRRFRRRPGCWPARSSRRSLVHLTARPQIAAPRRRRKFPPDRASPCRRSRRRHPARPRGSDGRAYRAPSPARRARCRAPGSARMKRQRLAARVVFGKTGARLDRERGLAVHAEAAFDAHRRGLRRRRRRRRA